MHTEIRFTDGVEVPHRHVKRYDGQMVFVGDDQTAHLELGNYLGGGAAGVVYESVNLETYEHVAVKMLNPLGFKLLSNSSMQRSSVLKEGLISDANVCQGRVKMSLQHVWWVKYRGEIVAAYKDARGTLRSLPLRRCIEIWGWNLRPSTVPTTNSSDEEEESSSFNARVVDEVSSSLARKGGETRRRKHNLRDPPDRYVDFLKSREYVYQEIRNMSKLNGHPNVLRLIEVLEYVQDSKTSIFLVLELASGGELFDRIAIDRGTDEDIARHYYRQVLQGIRYCHKKGVCHRDLKPENLLLSDDDEEPTLKIADFGLSSAIFGRGSVTAQATTQLRRLKSVVGSPHYVAPEVLNDNSDGYEGTKADVWSSAVILYALLAGNLPFGQNLLQCPRFLKWNEYCRQRTRILRGEEEEDGTGDRSSAFRKVPYPHWFFPRHFSVTARQLLTSLLNPDPESRISVDEALEHVWLTRNRRRGGRQQQQQYQQQTTIEEEMELEEKDIDDDEEEFKSNCVDEDVDSLSSSSSITTSATTTTTITTSTTTTLEKSFQKQVKIETSVVSQQEKTTNTIPIPSNSPTRRMLSPLDQLSFKSPPLMAQHGPGLDDIPDFSLDSPSDVLSSSRSHIESGGTGGKDRQKESSKRFVLSDFSSSSSSPSLPMFKDLVKRSTRFTTSVPASQVMSRIHDIVTKDRNRRVAIDLNAYKLTIEDAHTNVQICTVRVFQLRSRVYMVDFVRGQLLDTFQFRRFYDRIRDELTELVKKDYTLKLLEEFGTGSSGLRRSVLRRSKSC